LDETNPDILSYRRETKHSRVLVVLNMSAKAQTVKVPTDSRVLLRSAATLQSAASSIDLAPYGSVVLELK
jgi:hypothetical protein